MHSRIARPTMSLVLVDLRLLRRRAIPGVDVEALQLPREQAGYHGLWEVALWQEPEDVVCGDGDGGVVCLECDGGGAQVVLGRFGVGSIAVRLW
jgi:hypothetical protein